MGSPDQSRSRNIERQRRILLWAVLAAVAVAGIVVAVAVGVLLMLRSNPPSPEPVPPPPSHTPSATSPTTSASSNAVPPLSPAALRSVTVPAHCTMPRVQLVDGATPTGRFGEAHGGLVLSGPAGPVQVDLGGNGSVETVVAYGCGSSQVGAGSRWPPLLLAYRGDGTLMGQVALGEEMLLGDMADLRQLRTRGTEVEVRWDDTDGHGTTMARSGTLRGSGDSVAFTASGLAGSVTTLPGDDVVGFASPTGNILCDLYTESARCLVTQHSWTAPAPTDCPLDYGDTVEVSTGKGGYACHGDAVGSGALAADTEGRRIPQPSWFIDGVDPIVGSPSADRVSWYALSYGRTMRTGSFRCSSAEAGVTCTNTTTKHGFVVSRSQVRLF